MIILGVFIAAAALAVRYEEKIELLIAPVIVGMSIFLLFLDRLKLTEEAVSICCVVCLCAIAYLVYHFVGHKTETLVNICTAGGFAYLLFILLFFLMNYNAEVVHCADPQYWPYRAKMGYFNNAIWVNDGYPGMLFAWAYLSEKTWFTWSNTILLTSKDILLISTMLPLFEYIDVKSRVGYADIIKFLSAFFCILLIPYVNETNEYLSFQPDIIMMSGIALIGIYCSKAMNEFRKLYLVSVIILLCGVGISKRPSIMYVLAISFFITPVLMKRGRIVFACIQVIALMAVYFLLYPENRFGKFVYLLPLTLLEWGIWVKLSTLYKKHRYLVTILVAFIVIGGISLFGTMTLSVFGTYFDLSVATKTSIDYIKAIFSPGLLHNGGIVDASLAAYLFMLIFCELRIIIIN